LYQSGAGSAGGFEVQDKERTGRAIMLIILDRTKNLAILPAGRVYMNENGGQEYCSLYATTNGAA
jgi:hypothetical protein